MHKPCWSSACSALCYGGDTLKTVSVTQGWAGLGWAGLAGVLSGRVETEETTLDIRQSAAQPPATITLPGSPHWRVHSRAWHEGYPMVLEDFSITEKAPTLLKKVYSDPHLNSCAHPICLYSCHSILCYKLLESHFTVSGNKMTITNKILTNQRRPYKWELQHSSRS